MGILERAIGQSFAADILAAKSLSDLSEVVLSLFGVGDGEGLGQDKILPPEPRPKPEPGKSDYDNRVRGVKTRERTNEMAKAILEQVDDSDDLTAEQRQILAQYSGQGGLTENSQDQYYTPPEIARGVWDALKAHGFENGNALEPACGNGIFVGTKPPGVKVSANDLDPTAAKIAHLLNPDDDVKAGSLEEIAVATPDNHFDAITGNIPFGKARGASKHKDPAYQDEKRVDRYFILRTLDKLKPGGLACLIVPTVIVGKKDARWAQFRAEVSKKAEFLGAHKLPSKAFSKGETGTDTVVDVIVLQKHSEAFLEKVDSYRVEDLRAANVLWDEFIEGRWWEGDGKRFIMGTYIPALDGVRGARERVDGDIDSAAIRAKLTQRFKSRIKWDVLGAAAPVAKNYTEGDRRVINGQQHAFQGGRWVPVVDISSEKAIDLAKYGFGSVEEMESALETDAGMLSVSYGQAEAIHGAFWRTITPSAAPVFNAAIRFSSRQKDEFREQAYRGTIIGNRILQIMNGENVDEHFLEKTREMVAAEYARYGHPAKNKQLALFGQDSTAFGAFLNAMDKDGQFSELLKTGRIERKDDVVDTKDIGSIVTYLAVRLERSPLELQDVLDLYSGDAPIKSLGDIAEIEDLAVTPDGMIEPLHRYCSGAIYPKIADLTQAMARETDPRLTQKWQDQIDLMLSKATFTASDKISLTLQQKWFDPKYVVEFLQTAGGYENARYDEDNGEFYLTRGVPSGFNLSFQDYLNGAKMTARGGTKEEVEQKRREYAERLKDLTEKFNVFIQQHEDIEDITAEYNRKFNGFVPFEYPAHDLELGDMVSGEIINHTYQCSEIRRLSELGSGICGFGVGLGKSFTALGLVAYNLKKGRSKRTCFVVPDSVLENWYHEARTFYGERFFRNRVKFVGLEPKRNKEGAVERLPLKDAQGKQRVGKNGAPMFQDVVKVRKSPDDIFRDMWEIPQSNYAIVVMTKEKFRDIPIKPETRNDYVDEMVEMHLMGDSAAQKAREGGKKGKSYDEAVTGLSLEGKYAEARFEKGELPFFEDMGFDNVVYDECHFFKNSVEPGKVANDTAFIPTAGVAAIAREISVKSHYIRKQNCGRGVVGLSATPVTNSPFEIFNQLLQVADLEYFKNMGIHGPDDFIRTFGRIESVQKVKMTGEVKTMDGLKGFQNLDGLRGLFNRFVNVKTAADVGAEVHIPEGVERRFPTEMSEDQEAIYDQLREAGKEAIKNVKKDPGRVLSIMRDMERVATDPDMYFHQMTFTFPAKYADNLNALVKDLPRTKEVKVEDDEKEGETEKVKLALRYTLDRQGDIMRLVVPDDYEGDVMGRLLKFGISKLDVCHPLTPKYAELIRNAKKHLEQSGKQIIFTEEKTQHQKIIRILLMHLPISEDNVAVINATEANGDKLDKISKAYNGGQVKIVVANKKAEVGVNLQRGTTAIHHLTLPWTPASINQRNGRGVRQGNHVDFVDVHYYLAQSKPRANGARPGSLDDLRLNNLQSKARWIDELFNSSASEFLNPDADDDSIGADVFADDPEEAARIRKQRREEEAAKAREAARQKMRIELSKLAMWTEELDGLDDEKEVRREKLTAVVAKLERKLAEAEVAYKAEKNDDTRAELDGAKYSLQINKDALANLDANTERKRESLKGKIKMARGAMESAERSGNLPFDKALVENPKCVVHVNGTVFAPGKFVEIATSDWDAKKRAVCRVKSINIKDKTVALEYVVGTRPGHDMRVDGETMTPVNKVKAAANVAYTEDDVAIMRILAGTISYSEIPNKLTRDQFQKFGHQLKLSPYDVKAYRDQSGKLRLERYGDNTQGLVYPEMTDDFAREVVKVWVETKSEEDRKMAVSLLGESLFGKAWSEFVPKGTDAEISAEIARQWAENDYVKKYGDDPENLRYLLASAERDLSNTVMRLWPNTEDVKRVMDTFFQGVKADLDLKVAELQAAREREAEERRKQEEAERIAREKMEDEERKKKLDALKADPNFRELPQAIVDRLAKIGLTIRLNTVDVRLRGMTGSGKRFTHLFLSDRNAKSGVLYRVKDNVLKPIYKAAFTSDWTEARGAWWHMPIDKIDANGGLEKLAATLERNA